jgi:hypothetical protein
VKTAGLEARVDADLLRAAVEAKLGIPVDVTRGKSGGKPPNSTRT